MKTKIIALTALVASLVFANAAEKIKAPNGGRLIESVEPRVEFLVTADISVISGSCGLLPGLLPDNREAYWVLQMSNLMKSPFSKL